eukprot:598542-Rhodomonas_salina.1
MARCCDAIPMLDVFAGWRSGREALPVGVILIRLFGVAENAEPQNRRCGVLIVWLEQKCVTRIVEASQNLKSRRLCVVDPQRGRWTGKSIISAHDGESLFPRTAAPKTLGAVIYWF